MDQQPQQKPSSRRTGWAMWLVWLVLAAIALTLVITFATNVFRPSAELKPRQSPQPEQR